jgi:hypothetical protein
MALAAMLFDPQSTHCGRLVLRWYAPLRMNGNQELRRNWRRGWLSRIQEFADEETQRRSWLDPTNTNPHFSFIEYNCTYFDDLRLSEGYQWALEEGLVSADEIAAVAAFHAVLDAYESPTDDYDHEAILADPKWAAIVVAAKRAQDALLNIINDPQERRWLEEK